jgi:hypothetical protein
MCYKEKRTWKKAAKSLRLTLTDLIRFAVRDYIAERKV